MEELSHTSTVTDIDESQKRSAGIALICDGKILVTKHPKETSFENTLSLPKGTQEPDEHNNDYLTAQREVEEEVGIRVPMNWIVKAPKYEMKATSGRTLVFFVVHLSNLRKLKLDNDLINPIKYQRSEVDYACFVPLEKAKDMLKPDQQEILNYVGSRAFENGGSVGKVYIVKATDKQGFTRTIITDTELSTNPHEKIFEYFINNGIEIVDSDYKEIPYFQGKSDFYQAFNSFFESQTGEKISDEVPSFILYDKESKIVKKADIETVSGKLYQYNPDEMTFELFSVDEHIQKAKSGAEVRGKSSEVDSKELKMAKGGAVINKSNLSELTFQDAVDYFNDNGFTINGQKISEYLSWQDEVVGVELEDGSRILWNERRNNFSLGTDDDFVTQSANSKFDMEYAVEKKERGQEPIFDTKKDAKNFINFLKGIGETKITAKYKYLLTKDSDSYEIPNLSKEQLEEIFDGEIVTIESLDYDEDMNRKVVSTEYNFDNAFYLDISELSRLIELTFEEVNGLYGSPNLYILYEQDYMPNGKISKTNVEVYTQDMPDAPKYPVKDGDYQEILKKIKSLLNPKKMSKGGRLEKMDNDSKDDVEEKKDGGVIEGQLHSECDEPHGCGEKFIVDNAKMIEAERDEAVIVPKAFEPKISCPIDGCKYRMVGTVSQIASALNVLGGGKAFDVGAQVFNQDGKKLDHVERKKKAKDTNVEKEMDSGTIIINRRSMGDDAIYEAEGTAKQIASSINSLNGNGVVIEDGGTIKKA